MAELSTGYAQVIHRLRVVEQGRDKARWYASPSLRLSPSPQPVTIPYPSSTYRMGIRNLASLEAAGRWGETRREPMRRGVGEGVCPHASTLAENKMKNETGITCYCPDFALHAPLGVIKGVWRGVLSIPVKLILLPTFRIKGL
jgi:hypothetical protein